MAFTGEGPETGAGATGGDDDVEAGDFADGAEGVGGVVAEGGGDVDGGGHGEGGDGAGGEEGRFGAEVGGAGGGGHEAWGDCASRTVVVLLEEGLAIMLSAFYIDK